VSGSWGRSVSAGAVGIGPEGPTLHPDMLTTVLVSLAGVTRVFLGLCAFRYSIGLAARRQARAEDAALAGGLA